MSTQPKPQRVKITLQNNNRDVHVLSVDFQDARKASIIVFKGQQYMSTGMVYELKAEEHDDPNIDWRGHLVFEQAGKIVVVPDTDEIILPPRHQRKVNTLEI